MNGSAPKFSATGSQVEVTKKFQPNLCRGRAELRYSSKTSSTVTRKILAAKISVIRWAISSPLVSRRTHLRARPGVLGIPEPPSEPWTKTVEPDILVDPRNGFLFLGHDGLGQRGISQWLAVLLPVGHHPVQEVRDHLLFLRIIDLSRDQEPSEARDGVSVLAGGVGDGDSKVVGHLLGSAGGRLRHAGEVRLDEVTGGVLHPPVSDVVLDGVDKLHVANRVWRVLDQPRNRFVALRAQSHRPVH